PPEEADVSEPLPRELFPIAVGNRWRYRFRDGFEHNWGISAVTEAGVAVAFGSASALAERYTATEEELRLVAPSGQVLAVLLRSPLREGQRWDYARPDPQGDMACTAEVESVGSFEHADLHFDRCVTVRHDCERVRIAETHCAGVGRTARSFQLRSAPSTAEGSSTTSTPPRQGERSVEAGAETLIGYRVAGAPIFRPRPVDCRSVILLPSDVAAACGPLDSGGAPGGAAQDGAACRYRFRRADADIDFLIFAGSAPADRGRLLFENPRAAVVVASPEEACSAANLGRLEPVLASLLRD
ncbi:MAG: hypothetical protein AAGF12_24465, partial [Myxococcota bacterium]